MTKLKLKQIENIVSFGHMLDVLKLKIYQHISCYSLEQIMFTHFHEVLPACIKSKLLEEYIINYDYDLTGAQS